MAIYCSSTIEGGIINATDSGGSVGSVPRTINVPHNSSSGTVTFTFNAEDHTGMPGHGGNILCLFHGWTDEHYFGIIGWNNAGGGGDATACSVTQISASGLGMSVSIGSGDDINLSITGCHNNGHGWMGKLIILE